MKRILIAVLLAGGAWLLAARHDLTSPAATVETSVRANADDGDVALTRAFEQQLSNVQVQARGTVSKVLPDDRSGSRHQRFLLRMHSGQTLLIAHNIDLAPRIASLREGDTVAFYGEYEWNDKGGVVHWTHHDPQRRHVDGWLEHRGRRYQ